MRLSPGNSDDVKTFSDHDTISSSPVTRWDARLGAMTDPCLRSIEVASIPRPFPEDPYIELFYRALRAHGVVLAPPGPYTIPWLFQHHGQVQAFHLHWLHLFYDAPSRLAASLRFLRFCARLSVIKLAGFKLFWTAHNLQSHEKKHPLLDALAARLMALVADRVFVHGPTAAGVVADCLKRRDVVQLPHFAYVGYYPDETDRATARERLSLSSDEFVLLCFGKVRAYKGIEKLVAQFRAEARPADRLLIVGRPETVEIEAEMRELASGDERILLHLRFVPDDEAQTFFRAADLVVSPYRSILTSGAVAMAFTFGIPMVMPRLGSIPDVVNEEYGVLYEGDRIWPAIETLRAAAWPSLAGRVRSRGRELSWDKIAEVAARAFRETCDRT